MSKTLEQIELDLDAKIPRSAVLERDGGGGRSLSYLSGHYVIDRLNKTFGPLGWDKEIQEIKEVVNKTSRGEYPAYLVKLRLTVRIPGQEKYVDTVVKEAYGYGSDKSSQNAHELAIKEAVTDALKVAAKDLGMSLGLALYSRDQENVQEEEDDRSSETSKDEVSKESKPAGARPSDSPGTAANTGADTAISAGGGSSEPSQAKIEEAIRSHVRIADKQKKLSTDAFKAHLSEKYGVAKLAELTKEQALEVLAYIREVTK